MLGSLKKLDSFDVGCLRLGGIQLAWRVKDKDMHCGESTAVVNDNQAVVAVITSLPHAPIAMLIFFRSPLCREV